ncbi:MAG: hypothetical protein ACWIPJ_05870 [Polaribacter sp.]
MIPLLSLTGKTNLLEFKIITYTYYVCKILNFSSITKVIKLLIYKENPIFFEKIDFDDDNVFLEPLLFSKEILIEILQGYFLKEKKVNINYSFKKKGIAYIPKIGYFKNKSLKPFEQIEIIKGTGIEIVKYSHLDYPL